MTDSGHGGWPTGDVHHMKSGRVDLTEESDLGPGLIGNHTVPALGETRIITMDLEAALLHRTIITDGIGSGYAD